MDKKKIAVAAVLVVIMAVCIGLSAAYLNEPKDKYVPAILLSKLNLARDTAGLNCSFTVLNPDGVTVIVEAASINGVNLSEIAAATVYVNGTTSNCASQLFTINPLDSVKVNVVAPYECNSYLLSTLEDDHLKVQVQTPDAMFYVGL